MERSPNPGKQTIYPALRYSDAKAAIEWLKTALGFEENVVYPNDDGSIAHAQLALNGNLIMLGSSRADAYGKSPREAGVVTGTIYVALSDASAIDALYERAKNAGADIISDVHDTDYGSHEFGIRDPEGHPWSFGTYAPQA